jgi:hypothetical protein
MRGRQRAAALWMGLGLSGCGLFAGPQTRPDPSAGVEVVRSDPVVEFYERASAFYDRMAQRRFNTLATYEDDSLRRYFRDEASFADYYADLADVLDRANFEKNRPLSLEVREFLVEGPGRARVRVRIRGNNSLPLRLRGAVVNREDRWERLDGDWWVVPGKF